MICSGICIAFFRGSNRRHGRYSARDGASLNPALDGWFRHRSVMRDYAAVPQGLIGILTAAEVHQFFTETLLLPFIKARVQRLRGIGECFPVGSAFAHEFRL